MASFGSATLVLDGPDGGVTFEITGNRVTLGRTRDNDVVVSDVAASSHHAEIVVENDGLVIRDLTSSNGTFVNGRKIDSTVLFDGDLLRIGQSQGRISVRQPSGKPLRGKADRRPVILVALVVLVLLGVGGGMFSSYAQEKKKEHAEFLEYEQKAQELLKTDPCRVVSKAHLDQIHKLDATVAQLQFGKKGKLSATDKTRNETAVAAAKLRATAATDTLKRLDEIALRQKHATEEIKGFDTRFHDADLVKAAHTLDLVFAQQAATTEEFGRQWKDYAAYVTAFNTLVEGFVKAPEQYGSNTVDAEGAKSHDPSKLVQDCEDTFTKTSAEGMSKLAAIAE